MYIIADKKIFNPTINTNNMERREVLKTLGISMTLLGTGLFTACTGKEEVKVGKKEISQKNTPPPKPVSLRDKKIVNRDKHAIKDPENPTKAELKHTPEIAIGEANEAGFSEIKITIGQQGIIHPTTDAHWIDFISLSADEKLIGKVEFEIGAASGYATFRVKTEGINTLTAVSGCNLHGIWQSTKELK